MPRRNRNQAETPRVETQAVEEKEPRKGSRRSLEWQKLARQGVVIAAAVILVLVMLNLNSRLSEFYRLSSERDDLSTRVANLEVTQQVLQTQVAYSKSDQAAEDYAREAHMIREGEVLVVPFAPAGNPTPTPVSQTPTPSAPLNWQVWWALFFDQ